VIAALNGTHLGGRNLNVNEARPKAQGAGRAFGGPHASGASRAGDYSAPIRRILPCGGNAIASLTRGA